jgi:glycosyltransferase involved in cell wall biosynthesis
MISIIIPTKNEEKCLPKLLESIKKQNLEKYEVIVADANSTDNTIIIAKKFGCKVVKGGSPSFGRNSGANYSKYNLLCFVDADLIIPKAFFKKALEQIKEEKIDIAGTLQTPIKTKNVFKNLFYSFIFGSVNIGMILLQHSNAPGMQNCMFIKKEIHEKINGFDETMIYGEDADYSKRASKFGKFVILRFEKVKMSPRRLENGGIKILFKLVYFNIGRLFGHQFRTQSKIKYFDK